MTAHRDGDGDWRMRPARPSEGGKGQVVYRVTWRAAADCWMVDCSTVELFATYREAWQRLIEKRKERA
jgi:hypothetical protein